MKSNLTEPKECQQKQTVLRNFRAEDVSSTYSIQVEFSHNEFWPPQVLQFWIPLFQQSVQDYSEQSKNGWCETLYQKKQDTMIHSRFTSGYYVLKLPTFIWKSQKHNEGGGEPSAKANDANKIIKSCPVKLLFQPSMEKILGFNTGFSWKFCLQIIDK